MQNIKGLFLGAGASYECGMPLADEFTSVLKVQIIKRVDTKLFNLNNNPELKKYFFETIRDQSLNYEEIVGNLQDYYLMKNGCKELYSLIFQVIECIQLLLLEDQQLTLPMLILKAVDFSPLKKLVSEVKPLHIFSLNHDLIIEELSNLYDIELKDGFWEEQSHNYNNLGEIKSITKEQLLSPSLFFISLFLNFQKYF